MIRRKEIDGIFNFRYNHIDYNQIYEIATHKKAPHLLIGCKV